MAISVAQNPISAQGQGGRGYYGLGDCVFRVTSSSIAQPNFKFLVQIYDGATQIAKFVIAPNPQSMLMFNLYEFGKSFVQADTEIYSDDVSLHWLTKLGASPDPFSRSNVSIKRLEVRFGEKYDVLGVPTEFPGAGTLGADAWQVYFLPWLLQDSDGAYPTGVSRWNVGNALSILNTPLTDITTGVYQSQYENEWNIYPNIQIPCRVEDVGVLTFPHDAGTIDSVNNSTTLFYEIFAGASSLGTDTITVNATNGAAAITSTNEQDKLIHFGAFPANIANLASTIDPLLWPDALFNPTWTHYLIQVGSNPGSKSRAIYFVRVPSTTCRYDNIRLAWVGQKGGWNYWNFDKKNETVWRVDGKSYNKINGTYQNATFKKPKYGRGTTEFSKDVQKIIEMSSDWVSEEAFTYFKGIFLSKEVHIVDMVNQTHIPVTVEDKEYRQKTIRHSMVYNLSLKVKLSQQYNA